MFLFFHDIGFPLWAAIAALVIIVFCFLLMIRGFYVLITRTSRRTFNYLGTVFGLFSIIWAAFAVTKSENLQAICICLGLPFGFFAGMPFLLFIDLPGPVLYLGAIFLNLVSFCGAIEFIERIIARNRYHKKNV